LSDLVLQSDKNVSRETFLSMDGLRKSIFARRGRYETGILRELTYAVGFNFWPCVFSNGVSPLTSEQQVSSTMRQELPLRRVKTDDRVRPYNPMNGLYIRALVVALLGCAATF
jgi:hypothetical protein